MPEEESKLILYTTDDGKARVSLMSRDGRIWLNQKQMAELFAVTKMNVSLHISNILKEKELDESVVKSFFTTATDGKKYVERSDPSKPNMGLVTSGRAALCERKM